MNLRWKILAASVLLGSSFAAAGPAAAQTVTVFHDKPFYQEGWDGLTAAAKDANIDLQFSAYATDQFQAFIQQGLMSGSPPDAFTWWNGTKLEEVVASGQIAPLDDLWAEKIKSGEYDASAAEPFKVGDHIYGMPTGINRWVVFYNKALFEKAGITSTPKTWAELMDTAEKLKAAGITPFNASLQEGWRGFIWFEELLIRTDADAYEKLNKGELKYTDEPVKRVFEIWGDLYKKGYFTDPASQEEQVDFARGKAAMYLAGDWNIGLIEKAGLTPGKDFGTFIMPNVDPEDANVVIVEASPLVLTVEGAKKPEVMEFAKWYLSEPAMNAWATKPGLYAGNAKAKVPNVLVGEIAKLAADGNYKSMTRYWEASPSEIVLPSVEEMNRFMTNPTPEQAETAMNNMEAIASQYWAANPPK